MTKQSPLRGKPAIAGSGNQAGFSSFMGSILILSILIVPSRITSTFTDSPGFIAATCLGSVSMEAISTPSKLGDDIATLHASKVGRAIGSDIIYQSTL